MTNRNSEEDFIRDGEPGGSDVREKFRFFQYGCNFSEDFIAVLEKEDRARKFFGQDKTTASSCNRRRHQLSTGTMSAIETA